MLTWENKSNMQLNDEKTVIAQPNNDQKQKWIKKQQQLRTYRASGWNVMFNVSSINTILQISKALPEINFHLYGDIENSIYDKFYFKKFKNVKYLGFSDYKNIPKGSIIKVISKNSDEGVKPIALNLQPIEADNQV